MKRTMNLTTDPVPSLVRAIAVPASVGFFFNTMFNVVDTYFAGLISTQALAALSLSFPVFFIILALGSGVSTGTTALIATSLGAGDTARARMMAVQGVAFGVLLAAAVTALGLVLSPWLFSLLGASGDYLDLCLQYMNPIFWGSGFFILNYMLNAVLNAQGDTVSFRNFLIISFFLNCLLDPWLMYGWLGLPAMGITGIALATVLIQLTGCLYLGNRVRLTELMCRDCLKEIAPRPRAFGEIIGQGLPTSLNFVTVGLGVFVITYFVSAFGREAVAAYGVATRVEQIMLLPAIGLNIATVTIVAQNNGARQFARISETVRTALAYGGAFMAAAGIVLFIAAGSLMRLFTGDGAVVGIGTFYLRIAAFVLYSYVILYVNVAALQGVKKPGYGLFIGVLRQIALPLIVFPLFSRVMNLGLAGIWWGIFAITWSAAIITSFYARARLKALR
ncbi:MAG TPA: MATE family efflux transporter [Deltaproteobacteria bacterium]|nr:MATE family efflux transporter [Deltaproteobacteria bacterium]